MNHPVVLVLCSGFHPPSDTEALLELWAKDPILSRLPAISLGMDVPWAPLSAHTLRQSLDQALGQTSHHAEPPDLILWAFSAGCVGAMALAHHWHRYRGTVRAIFLVDGLGVPGVGAFPCHRLSHDAFTHHSSRLLGSGQADFWADPAVPHRQLWRSPQTATGRGSLPPTSTLTPPQQPLSAADFLTAWTTFYFLRG
jgi:hypothetical protein